MSTKHPTTPRDLIRQAGGDNSGIDDEFLPAVMIAQALDRVVRAINRNTAAINFANDNILEDRDLLQAAEAAEDEARGEEI